MNLTPVLPHGAAYAARCHQALLTDPTQLSVRRRNGTHPLSRALGALTCVFARSNERRDRAAIEHADWRRTPARSIH